MNRTKSVILSVLLTLMASTPLTAQEPITEAQLFNEALELIHQGDAQSSLEISRQLIELSPDNVNAYLLQADAYTLLGDFARVTDILQNLYAEHPKSYPVILRLSNALFVSGSVGLSMELLNDAITDTDSPLYLRMQRANQLVHSERIEEAIAELSLILDYDPDHLEALELRSHLWLYKSLPSNAVVDLNNLLQLKEDDAQAMNNLAWILATAPQATLRDGSRAVELAIQACKLTNWQVLYCIDTLAAAYAEAGDFESAVKYMKVVLYHCAEEDVKEVQHRISMYQKEEPFRSE